MSRALWLVTVLLVLSPSWATAQQRNPAGEVQSPVSPEESLRHLVLAEEGLAVELAACEPQVVDPVAIRFDEDGRMWVAEMHDYPLGAIKPGAKRTEKDAEPMSRIKVLEDGDSDGRFEKATLFADGLRFVTGLQPWKGGVIVTLSGRVAYMKDTDWDGKADEDETWFTGFSEGNSQLRANHPTFALDNHIYIPNGLRGGKVVNHLLGQVQRPTSKVQGREKASDSGPGTRDPGPDNPPSEAIPLSGMDFRFDPLTGQAEAVSGNGQFGLTFDDWGNRFICSNRNPCMHVVIENRYLARAPNVAVPAVVHDVAAAGENSRIFPLTRAWTTSNLHAGQFTAACGVFIYRGDLLPSLGGSVFTCDPTGNLIHREIMSAKGPTFESKPAYEGREFLASRDEWFRPVSMQLGPDGALYVVDMYRAVIEHPEWVPDELKNRPDERLGDDRGRIYRIVPSQPAAGGQRSEVGGQGASRPRRRGPFPKLSQAASDQLVILLAHENAWQRETAQRLLVERQDRSVEDSLQRAAREKESPVACAHALWTLIGIGSHRPDHVTAPLRSPDARLRQCAMAALESFDIASNSTLKLLVLDHVVHDDSATLRLRAAMLPITQPGAQAVSALGATAVAHCDDPWMRRLFLLSVPNVPDAAQSLAFEFDPRTPGQRALFREVIEADVAQFGLDWAPRLMDKLLPHDASMPLSARSRVGLVALAEAVQKRRSSLAALAKSGVPDGEKRIRLASDLAAAAAEDDQLEEPARLDALQLLGFLPNSQPTLTAFALRDDLPPYRQVAIRSLARLDAIEPWTILVERLPFEAPQVRSAILDGVLQRAERIALLLDAMEAGTMKAAELDRVQMDRLLAHRDATIRQRAEKIFGSATPEDRQKALEDYQKVLAMSADPLRGKQVFARNCANCHKIGEIGVNVAPDISDSRTKTPAQLLADIIQPNRAIDANYIAWNVLLADGNSASGVLAAETSTSITLRQPEGKTLIISRSDIEQLKSSGLSLMPEGLEKNIPPQEMADLISFIKNWRYLDGRIPASR